MFSKHPIVATVLTGCVSLALYVLLFLNSDWFVELARRTREGEKLLFLTPIIVAFVFSYVHGAFTGLFWEAIGLRASSRVNKKK